MYQNLIHYAPVSQDYIQKFYFLFVLSGSHFNFKQNSKALLTQFPPSNTEVSFLHLSLS